MYEPAFILLHFCASSVNYTLNVFSKTKMQLGGLAIVRSTILTTEHFFRFYTDYAYLR